MTRIAIVDYGVGNLASVRKALGAAGADAQLVRDPERIRRADAIVLPGVGHFGHCARLFHAHGFAAPLREARGRGVPILGICVGMQLFFERSEEAADAPGLGLLPGSVVRMSELPRLPHIGWNEVRLRGDHPWLVGLAPSAFYYFVHSYVPRPTDPDVVLGTFEHHGERTAIVGTDGLLGVQFHPEKSGPVGLRLLRTFVGAVGAAAGVGSCC